MQNRKFVIDLSKTKEKVRKRETLKMFAHLYKRFMDIAELKNNRPFEKMYSALPDDGERQDFVPFTACENVRIAEEALVGGTFQCIVSYRGLFGRLWGITIVLQGWEHEVPRKTVVEVPGLRRGDGA